MTNYSFFIGSDISKRMIDVAFHNGDHPVYLGEFENCNEGFKLMVGLLLKQTKVPTDQWFFCFENTGVYSKPLLEWLCSKQIACKEENALVLSRSMGLKRGKTDKIDSRDICKYIFEKRDSALPTQLTSPLIKSLKTLLSSRELLVRLKRSLVISLKEQKNTTEPQLYQALQKGNTTLVEIFNDQIDAIEQLIQTLIESNEKVSKNDKLARSVIGIGPITSARLIESTANYTKFNNARKYACYCGIAPFPNQSGIRTGRRKISQMANKKIKALLSNCVIAAIQHDKELKQYYHRKLEEGKHNGAVLNAVKNKLVQRVFAVIKRQKPYVKMLNYA